MFAMSEDLSFLHHDSVRRKFSAEDDKSLSGSNSASSLSSSLGSSGAGSIAAAPLKLIKPCLKRRSSAPVGSTTTAAAVAVAAKEGLVFRGGSCDSLNEGESLLSESYGSRKSVSFADSITGGALCHIKLFQKDLSETGNLYPTFDDDDADEDLQILAWQARMYNWQNMDTLREESGAWYDCDLDLEDQDRLQYVEEDEDDESIYMTCSPQSRLSNVIEEEEEEEEILPTSRFTVSPVKTAASAANTVVSQTFLCPKDLPEYADHLAEKGVSLEGVSVLPEQHLISGTMAVKTSFVGGDGVSPRAHVAYSRDGWATQSRVEATAMEAAADVLRFGFVLDTRTMEAGDDLELSVGCDLVEAGEVIAKLEDNNLGSMYRFICKNKPKFQPGKSLW